MTNTKQVGVGIGMVMAIVQLMYGCSRGVDCAPGEVPNEALQECVIPKTCADGTMLNERNECVDVADAAMPDAAFVDAGTGQTTSSDMAETAGSGGMSGTVAGPTSGSSGASGTAGSHNTPKASAGSGGASGAPSAGGTGSMQSSTAGAPGTASDPCANAKPSAKADGCCPSGANASTDIDCKPVCGNGAIEMGEACDPSSSCPTLATCKSPDACLVATVSGDPDICTAKCELSPITMCKSGDGCCPMGCNYGSDTDCSQSCGDGVVSGAETCEPTSKTQPCATSCDDGDPCTTDMQTGSASQCNVTCTHAAITAPANGDGCCPKSANANNDSDCKPTCGNGVVEGNEICDGNCPTSCIPGSDPCKANTLKGTASACTAECVPSSVTACKGGDGCCAPGCTNSNDGDCAAPPHPAPVCGNGILEAGEECDAGGDPKAVPATGNTWECNNCQKANKYIACKVDADCNSITPVCYIPKNGPGVSGACTTPCTSASMCPETHGVGMGTGDAQCFGSDCRPTCSSNLQCPKDLVCIMEVCLP